MPWNSIKNINDFLFIWKIHNLIATQFNVKIVSNAHIVSIQ